MEVDSRPLEGYRNRDKDREGEIKEEGEKGEKEEEKVHKMAASAAGEAAKMIPAAEMR